MNNPMMDIDHVRMYREAFEIEVEKILLGKQVCLRKTNFRCILCMKLAEILMDLSVTLKKIALNQAGAEETN